MDSIPLANAEEPMANESIPEPDSDDSMRTRKEALVLDVHPVMEISKENEDLSVSPVTPDSLYSVVVRKESENYPEDDSFQKSMITISPFSNNQNRVFPMGFCLSPDHMFSKGDVTMIDNGQKILEDSFADEFTVNAKQSITTSETPTEMKTHKPMTSKEKKEWSGTILSVNLGLIYCMLLVTLGGLIYIWDVLVTHERPIAEGFNIYLIVVQIFFLIYIHVDCRHYTNLIAKKLKEAERQQEDDKGKESIAKDKDEIPQNYGFTSGRHGGSLYVKIGAAVFCIAYMIQGGLELGQKSLYVINTEPGTEPCTSVADISMSVLKLAHVFYMLFFVFKFSNIIINHRLYISNFGIMHCIGASLCFWIYNILQETFQSLSNHPDHNDAEGIHGNGSYQVPDLHEEMTNSDSFQDPNKRILTLQYSCDMETQLTTTINDLTPYLYPFSIEFSILMVGVWFLILENVGKIERHTHIPSIEVTYENEETTTKSLTSNFTIYVDCHASMRGLFAGLIVTVFTTIAVILFYVLSATEETEDIALQITAYGELIIFLMMLIASIIVYYHLQKLDIITQSINHADDILLFTCLPLIFLYAIGCSIPYIGRESLITWFYNVTQIIQAIVQTAVICDGLRRCSNSSSLRNKKPGRELIMFLLVSNLAMWVLQTFQIKSKHGNADAYGFYGKEVWTLLSHFTLPFVLFYRFHSSACLADMWMEAYTAEESH